MRHLYRPSRVRLRPRYGNRSLSLDARAAIRRSGLLERREQHDLADRPLPGEDHGEAVDSQAQATRRGHPLLQRLHEDLVVGLGLLVAGVAVADLGLEAGALVVRIVE